MKFNREEALELVRQAKELFVAKGKKLLHIESVEDASDEALAEVILGRSGTLRAPAIRVQSTFFVGYHADGYESLFGS